ncbi:prenyltransferase/squalene oxidase repeat-containing protein [Paenibacillus sp. NPDC057967]|uniref:prenyltransferase/squalene oxidase repeat-containing protein n=1 Tax=Paenibacillus sp. NPDC057967 TaxID=3346293 RepID=UPI0036D89D83
MTQLQLFEKAREFIYRNARLLDRQRFAYGFEGGSKASVLEALAAYQNEDGGFGHALEPDIRCPQSQPVPTEHALIIIDELEAYDTELMEGMIRYLKNITLPEGGFPLAFRSLMAYPHAPWWITERDDVPNLNPTGHILGLLMKHPRWAEWEQEDWVQRNLRFVWQAMEKPEPGEYHEGVQWVSFLEHAPVTPQTSFAKEKLDTWLAKDGVIERNPYAEGYVQKVLDWVAAPDSYAAKFVSQAELNEHLDALIKQQSEDGGWPISFPAASPLGELEWRGSLTVDRLKTLRSFGKL